MAIARTALKGIPEDYRDEAIAGLVRLYEDASRRLLEISQKRLVRDARTLTVEAKRARLVLVEIEAVLADLDAKAAAWIAKEIPASYRRGARDTLRGLREVGIADAVSFAPQLHSQALDVLVSDLQDDLLQASELWQKNQRRILRRTQLAATADREITRRIGVGLIAGETRRTTARGIAQALQAEFGDKVQINGRFYDVKKYAELVARTKTREAVTAGNVNRMVEMGQDLVMVTAHGSRDGCGFYEGRVFSISGTHPKYPPLTNLPNGGPPFHPNCRHNLAPFVEDLASGAEKRRGAAIDKRALNTTYAEVEKLAKREARA